MNGLTVTRAIFAALAGALLMAGGGVAAEEPGTAGPGAETGLISIVDAAPMTYYGMLRYPKFYGDPNMDRDTVDGSLADRQYLLGSLGGARNTWADSGWLIDADVTQVVQGAASGPGDDAQYIGSADLWVGLDTGRAGLWSGGLLFAHVEGDWGNTVTGTGALLPLNADAIMPAAPSSFALSELYIFQGLPHEFAAIIGKVDWAAYADTSLFANDERNQFMNEGLVNNPILGAFIPYTSLGGGLFKQFNAELGGGIVVSASNTNATSSGFSDLCGCALTYGLAGSWTPKFSGRPGNYSLLVGYNSKDPDAFDIDARYFLGEIVGVVPIAKKNGNYAAALGGSQYLWVKEDTRRSDGKPVGAGPFFRMGWAPKDRNVIAQFYSLGFGGYGGLFGRLNDNWGIGWAGTYFSDDLRGIVADLGFRVNASENVVEAFYNITITPAVRITLDVQNINSANPARDTSFVVAARLQIDL